MNLLRSRGVDVQQLVPKTKQEIDFNNIKEELINLQGAVSLKRADIIDKQSDLFAFIEPVVYTTFGEIDNSWGKMGMTKLWFDKLNDINLLINEHENLLKEFENTYIKLENIRKY